MLVRVGLAVTGAVAAVTYGRHFRSKNAHLTAPEGHGDKRIESQNESPDAAAQQKTPAEEVKRVNPSSPARSLREGGGSDYGDTNLLLPEFDDLLHSAEIAGLSPRSARSGVDGEVEVFRVAPGEEVDVRARIIKSRGGRVGSRRSSSPGRREFQQADGGSTTDGDDQRSDTSDLFPDGPDYLLGEYVNSLASEAEEIHALRETVKVLKQKESRMEAELLDYYDLEDQEHELQRLEAETEEKTARIMKLEESLGERNVEVAKLQTLIAEKSAQILKLRERIVALETRATKLTDEAASVGGLRLDLEEARARNRELQKQINTRTGNDKAELLVLKQKVASLESEKEDRNKRDLETEQKLQVLREMEVEVMELRRTKRDLQFQKRELSVKLDAAEEDIDYLQSRTEEDILAEAEEDMTSLRHTNEDLARQVEGLQNDRFTEVEELVYLRWVNACLRYELRNFQAPDGQFSAMDLNKELSPRSQEKAKLLMLQYAGPDMAAMRSASKITESGYESTSSEGSSPSEDYSDPFSEAGSGSASGRLSKKNSLIKRLKSWTGRKDNASERSPVSPQKKKTPSKGAGLEALLIRNTSDAVQITTYGAVNDEAKSPRTPTRSLSNLSSPGGKSGSFRSNPISPRLASTLAPIRTATSPAGDRFNGIAASFQVIAKSVPSEISAKFPAFKDRHRAAMEREQAIKEKAQAEREKHQAESLAQVKNSPRSKWSETVQGEGESPELESSSPSLKREEVVRKPITPAEIAKRELRKPNPPPKPSRSQATSTPGDPHLATPGTPPPPPPPPLARGSPGVPPPPPPPPLGGFSKPGAKGPDDVHRAPEVVEFYQSLVKRDAKNALAASAGGLDAEARNNMIGEIENRSTHVLAIKADVETQGEFVMSLGAEVRAAAYSDIKDVVDFVAWLDDELSFLVDERAVLKHFDWPEGKADAMREAAFEYKDLTKLLAEVSQFQDRPQMPCDKALKKMLAMLEKVEQCVYGLLRTREMAMARYKEFSIPVQWMFDAGIVGKIKLASVKLARLYMKRVSTELEQVGPINEPVREFLLLQGVRFAFRVHQFAGGFDPESMRAFEALRNFSLSPASPPAQRFVKGNEEQ